MFGLWNARTFDNIQTQSAKLVFSDMLMTCYLYLDHGSSWVEYQSSIISISPHRYPHFSFKLSLKISRLPNLARFLTGLVVRS